MIVFLNHTEPRCGVYQMGARIGRSLEELLGVRYVEGPDAARAACADAEIVVHNWHPSTLTWSREIVDRAPSARHVGIVHEIAASTASGGSDLFRLRVACDPTFPADGRSTFRTVRHVPRYRSEPPRNDRFTLGSFGFGVGGKLFHHLVSAAAREFPGCRVRLHMPRAFFGDDDGAKSSSYARDCSAIAESSGVEVVATHDFLDEQSLLDWLAANDMNVFFYERNAGRGVSSAVDYAIAARRPVAVNDSEMFRHVHAILGHYPERSLESLFQNARAVRRLYEEWSPSRLAEDFDAIFSAVRRST